MAEEAQAPLRKGTLVQFQLDPDQDPAEVAELVGNVEITVIALSTVKVFVSERQLLEMREQGTDAVEGLLERVAESTHDAVAYGWRIVGPLGDTIAKSGVHVEVPEEE